MYRAGGCEEHKGRTSYKTVRTDDKTESDEPSVTLKRGSLQNRLWEN